MPYTLITATGRVYTFYILAAAKIFLKAYGGTLVTDNVLVDNSSKTTA
jgi:hypothetical protein